ncbi:hypothetical protein AB0D62_05085 [Streptomyces massasporeus]|uniref:hypothetical protein n=1 Tax=Streptomyces massasporeus TaxID=67324 RepID=UPI0033F908E3
MATTHWLGDPPAEHDALTAWALSRIAATVAEDARVDAVVEIGHEEREFEPELGGRFGSGTSGGPASRRRSGGALTFRLDGVSPALLREEDSDEPWAVLFDPARLIRGIGAVTRAEHGEGYVELSLVPHPLFADPADAWLPPGARGLVVRLDPITGFLSSATLHDDRGPLATARVHEVSVHDVRSSAAAGRVVARMARTLVEPVRLTADVAVEADPYEDLAFTGEPSARSWTVSVGGRELTVTGDYAPDATSPVAARLAELLAPARVVSHLAHVTAVSATSVRAGVRPLRTFPLSAWAPDECLTCGFTVDPETGVLTRAEAAEEEGGRVIFRHVVTALGARRSG